MCLIKHTGLDRLLAGRFCIVPSTLRRFCYSTLARIWHEWPAANRLSTAMAARNAKAPIRSMSIELHRRFTVSHPTHSTHRVLVTTTHAICGLAVLFFCGPQGALGVDINAPFIAYNDFSWAEGQVNGNITRYTSNEGSGIPPDGASGFLRDYASDTYTSVHLAVSGGDWNGKSHTRFGSDAAAGTDAFFAFGGVVDGQGVLSYGENDITLLLRFLNPCLLYEITLFGNRDNPAYEERLSRITLLGADAFINASSDGVAGSLSVEQALVGNGFNTLNGHVVRYSSVDPGQDGTIRLILSAGNSSDNGVFSPPYVNALRVEVVGFTFDFVELASSGTLLPNGSIPLSFFNAPPVWDGHEMAFWSQGGTLSTQQGIYVAGVGQLRKAVDQESPIPSGTGLFTSFDQPSLHEGALAFRGLGEFQEGIYLEQSNVLTRIVDELTPVPGGIGSFTAFGEYRYEDGKVAFRGFELDRQGIYLGVEGNILRMVDEQTIIPGGSDERFTGFRGATLDDGQLIFVGSGESGQLGIYGLENGEVCPLVERFTPTPDGRAEFLFLGDPSPHQGEIVFASIDTLDRSAIYRVSKDGSPQEVVSQETKVPGTEENFLSFDEVSYYEGRTAFIGSDEAGSRGLYFDWAGLLSKVVTVGDQFDGREVVSVAFDREGLVAESMAFLATFFNEDEGVYVASPKRMLGPVETFQAFNDLSWEPGQQNENITVYTTNQGPGVPPEGHAGFLKDHKTGRFVPAFLTVTGGHWVSGVHTKFGSNADVGTDAHLLFDGVLEAQGEISYDEEPVTLLFEGLSQEMRYTVWVFGNRNKPSYADRLSKTSIEGADAFVNESSLGALFSGPQDASVRIVNGANTENGYVAKFADIDPGADGQFIIKQSDGESSNPPRYYINAIALQAELP